MPSSGILGSSRKRTHEDASLDILFSAESASDSPKDAPYLLTFPGVRPPLDTQFQAYKNSSTTVRKAKQRIIAADTTQIQYVGDNFGENSNTGVHAKYLLAVYDRGTGDLSFEEAPVIHMSRKVRALKESEAVVVDKTQIMKSRNYLGEAFGTKKIKQKIKAIEKNRIDAGALSAASGEIKSTIDRGSNHAPSKEQLEEELLEDRPIPPYDPETTDVKEIFKYNDIITPTEYSALNIKDLIKVRNKMELRNLLTGEKTSEYVMDHMNTILATTTKDKHRAKTVLYVHYLISLYKLPNRSLKDPSAIAKGIQGLPMAIANSFCQKFAVKVDAGGGNLKYNWSARSKNKILMYLCALCLILDNFSINLHPLTNDLGLSLAKLSTYLRELGCNVQALTQSQRDALGISEFEGRSAKRAVLTAPIKFPPPRKMKK